MLEKTFESFLKNLDCNEIQPVHPKGNQSWVFIGRTDLEAETPILWPPHAKSWLIGKDPDAGKDWRQEEKGMTEDEMIELHHRLSGHEFEQTPGDSEGQGSLVCCSPWGSQKVGHNLAIEQKQQSQWWVGSRPSVTQPTTCHTSSLPALWSLPCLPLTPSPFFPSSGNPGSLLTYCSAKTTLNGSASHH